MMKIIEKCLVIGTCSMMGVSTLTLPGTSFLEKGPKHFNPMF
jgi:hypothetical protein